MGTDSLFADRLTLERCRQTSGVEHLHEEVDFGLIEVAGDLPAGGDRAADHRGRLQPVIKHDAESAFQPIGRIGQILAGQHAEPPGSFAFEQKTDARGERRIVEIRAHPAKVTAGDVVGIDHRQQFGPVARRPGHHSLVGLHLDRINPDPTGQRLAILADGRSTRLFRHRDCSSMPGIGPVGQDPKLQHPGTRDDFLDLLDFRLLHLRQDHLDLIKAELANGHLLLATRIHAATDRGHEFVHRYGRGLRNEFVVEHKRVGPRLPGDLADQNLIKLRLLQLGQKGLSGCGVGCVEPNPHLSSGSLLQRRPAAFFGQHDSFEPSHGVIHPHLALFSGGHFVDQNQPALEINAEPRRPTKPADHSAGGQCDQNRGQPAPHIRQAEALCDHPGQKRRHHEHAERDQPSRPAGLPPGQAGDGVRDDFACGLSEEEQDGGRSIHAVCLLCLGNRWRKSAAAMTIRNRWSRQSLPRRPAAPGRCSPG